MKELHAGQASLIEQMTLTLECAHKVLMQKDRYIATLQTTIDELRIDLRCTRDREVSLKAEIEEQRLLINDFRELVGVHKEDQQ